LAKAVGEKPSAEQLTAWQETFSQPIAGGPTTRGFDHYFGTDVPNWPPYCFIEDNRTVGLPTAFLPPALLKGHLASKQGPAIPGWELEKILPALTDRACRIIEEGARSEQPFFLYLPLTSPHTPLAVNKEWLGKSGLGTYADLVMETDAAVGRVLNAIEQSGEAERTLVIFTSDNGCAPYIGAAEMEKQGHFPSGPWRGYKSDAWEGGHRVPFIVRWPGVATAGSVCGQLVQQSDWMATLAEVLQKPLAANAGEDSFSLLPLLEGKDQPVREFAVSQSSQGLLAVRQGKWKLIVGQGSGGWSKGSDDHPGQLYDLAADPGETKNRWADDPQRVEQMKGLLEKLITPGRSTPGPAQANDVAVNWQRFLQPGAGNKKGAKKKAG
jgi:arylsulfatase A-like enzyme